MQATPLFESQFQGLSYEHSNTPCASISCDYCDTPCDDLEELSGHSFPLAVAPSLGFSTVSDHPEGSLIVHDSSLPLAPLGELKEGDDFETDASLDDQCGTIVGQRITFLRSILSTSLILLILVILHVLMSLVIPFLISLILT